MTHPSPHPASQLPKPKVQITLGLITLIIFCVMIWVFGVPEMKFGRLMAAVVLMAGLGMTGQRVYRLFFKLKRE